MNQECAALYRLLRRRRLLSTTDMELKAMAALAHMGFRSRPVTGKSGDHL